MFGFPSSTLNNASASISPTMLMSKVVPNTNPANDVGLFVLAMEQKCFYENAKRSCAAKNIPHIPPKKVPTKQQKLFTTRPPTAKKMKKQVQFQVDENDKIVSQEFYFNKVPKENHCDLYFSRQEKKSMAHEAIIQADMFRLDHGDDVSKLECAFSSCCKEGTGTEDTEANNLMLRSWSSSEMRGLEKQVTSMYHDNIHSTMAGILGYQGYLKTSTVPKSKHDELLRAYSEKLSRRSRAFAAKVGVADALSAVRLHRPNATGSGELEVKPL